MIQTEVTPNPESLKFLSENVISATGTEEFQINDIPIIEVKNISVNYPIIFLLILFPIYKYTSSNNGIGKLDSFPSIMHRELKTMFQWKLEDKDLFKCSYIDVEIEESEK